MKHLLGALVLTLTAACTTNVGELALTIVSSQAAGQAPLANAADLRPTITGPDLHRESASVPRSAGELGLPGVPVGDNRRLLVEALGPEGDVVALGATGPLRIREGQNALSLYVGLLDAFSNTPEARLGTPRAFHTATLLGNGQVLLCGGISSAWEPESGAPLPAATASAELLDGSSLMLAAEQPGSMDVPRVGHTSIRLTSGNLLLAGGLQREGSPAEQVEVFKPGEAQFFLGDPLQGPRAWHHAALLEGEVLLVGGADTTPLSTSEVYRQGKLSPGPNLLTARRAFALTTLHDGTLLVTGGLDSSDRPLDSIELLAPGALSWKLANAKLAEPRAYHTATLLEDDTVLIAGGLTALGPSKTASTSLERFDPQREAVVGLPEDKLLVPRWAHSATLLEDGSVLVAGGLSGGAHPLPTAYVDRIYFLGPNVVQVTKSANLREARAGHSATLLQSGWLLVTGGISSSAAGASSSGVSQTAEVFVYARD